MNTVDSKQTLFQRIISYFTFKRDIRKIYCAFFTEQIKKEQSYQLMDEIPENVNRLYKRIIRSKKNEKNLLLYEKHNEIMTIHNKKINKINESLINFDYETYLNNPINLKVNQIIDEFKDTFDLINTIKVKSNEFINFSNNYIDIVNNLDIIQTQYNEFQLLEKTKNIDNFEYIDGLQKQRLYEIIENIKNNVKHYKKKYYHFIFVDIITNINIHNDEYIKNNIDDEIFNNINGKSLDIDQRTTILKDDISNLTVAGAGSGKTLTICGKVKYLTLKKNVLPKDILLLSYSHKSCEDLKAKVCKINPDLNVSTFHALGLNILTQVNAKKMTIEEQFKAIIEKYFREEIFKDNKKLMQIISYYGLYMNDEDELPYHENDGELYEDLKNQDLITIKEQVIKYNNDKKQLFTLKKELVKSKQELAIANYYFINGIKYEYEKPYEIKTATLEKRQYTPDFYLPDYGIYHEHYGIDKDGRCKQYNQKEEIEYLEGMKWKREQHFLNNTRYIETYSYEFKENTIFSNLSDRLKKFNVQMHPLSGDEILKVMKSIYHDFSFNSLKNLITTFVSLYKAKYKDEKGFDDLKESKFPNHYIKNRSCLFLDICKGLYIYYIKHLKEEDKIDFDDMILQSTDALDNLENFKYKYIIVDEFQDISQSRMIFLKKLIHHGNSRLFAVGDDWQSIYRFAGCDVNIFIEFKKYFNYPEVNFIKATHRNSQELQDIACRFIMSNPNQLKKQIKSEKHLLNPIRIAYYDSERYDALLTVFKEISLLEPNAKVMLLGRNNRDIEMYINNNFSPIKRGSCEFKCYEYPNLKISYSTVHGSKGLEEDYVVIINTLNKKYGFPNKMEDDPVLNLVLGKPDEFNYSEERRLWYVALTRTRNYTFLLVNIHSVSIFVKEILAYSTIMNPNMINKEKDSLLCPQCKTGHLQVKQNGDGKLFYGCDNYPYCDYTNNYVGQINKNHRCIKCGDYMHVVHGKYGDFYGCNSYPKCDYKEKIEK